METKEIVKHCKSGNQVAQSVLFNTYYQQMFSLSMRILSNHHDTEDVLIEAFTKAFANIRKFEYRGELSLNKWIKTIVINESIRKVNSKNKIKYDDDIPEHKLSPLHSTEISDIDTEQIYSIIGSMPDGYRMVFNLYAIEGYSHKEISELLKITVSTSKSQLRKARLNIMEKINKTKQNGY